MFQGSSPITLTSPTSKAHQKSGSFPPPALPGLNGRTTLSDTPADRTGACVDCFPARAAFLEQKTGRRLHRLFRGLLELHSRYNPLDRSTAQGGLCHEASARPVTQPNRSSASRSIDNCLNGIFLHR